MKLKIQYQATKEVEIQLPAFMKSNCHFYKVISEKKCIQVCTLSGNTQIAEGHADLAFMDGNIPATEKEFEASMKKVYKGIMNLINQKDEK